MTQEMKKILINENTRIIKLDTKDLHVNLHIEISYYYSHNMLP